ncbi:cGMP-dependent 3',5'-cyclic phosphodiesterase-like isoform X2 [Gigantopelta aegis]|uniref:cGMP-dependent 3',5'-cyclic phosphodiesterase-like isoform X2 n=1 Tax=Gigantopelta aegis TaxID=1735272 RepID=UPI001B88C708|nr:cGMP-dependent 3',5'-cyclic phosphodiesterase-like isoform X2 [Gigantopelta aegis]
MVIVLTHTIVSAFLYMRNSEQFLTHRNCQLLDSSCNQSKHAKEYVEHRDSLPSFFEEAFNPLLEAKTISELRAAISKALLLIFPQQAGNAVYLTNPDTRRIECEEDKTLPTRGILWRAYQEHDQTLYQIPSKEDPIKSALGVTTINQTNQLVLCVPIQERDDNENIGLVVIALPPGASCCPPSAEATIHYLTKQVSLCYQVIKNAFTRRKSICVSDTHFEALIRLCGELYDQDADKLQIKVIKYLEHRTQAQSAFLLLVVPDSLELFCQVVGSKILSHEVRFPGQLSPFSKALETKEPIGWDEISEDHQHMVEELAGIKIKSLLCVPVRRKGSERLVALACVINKKGTIGFTSEDIHGIHQCFQYTATVLTSTLAFQNERKLKDQTQALLHVARKLFTRLGKFPVLNHKSTDYGMFSRYFHEHSNSHEPGDIRESDDLLDLHESNDAVFLGSPERNVCNSTLIPVSLQNLEKQLEHQEKVADSLMDHYEGSIQKTSKRRYRIHPKLKSPNSKRPKDLDGLFDQEDNTTKSPYKKKAKTMFPKEIGHGDYSVDADLDDYLDPILSSSGEDFNQKWLTPSESSLPDYPASRSSSDVSHDRLEIPEYQTARNKFSYDSWARMNIRPLWKQSFSDSYLYRRVIAIKETTPDMESNINRHGGYLVQASKSEPLLVHSVEHFASPCNSKSSLNVAFFEAESLSSCTAESDSSHSVVLRYDLVEIAVEDVDSKTRHTITTKTLSQVNNICVDNIDVDYEEDQKNWPPSTYLLQAMQPPLANEIPFELNDLTKLLREIMQEARNLTNAERCSVFLIDNETDELVSKVFDGISANDSEVQQEIRMPKMQGIAGHVATTGNLLNITDAYSHPLFYRGIDDSTGFRTRNILTFPIKNEEDVVLGVAQLCNKKTGPYFTVFDEDIASAFAVYCCISISHSLMYKKVLDAQYRNHLANELMMYHMKVSPSEVEMYCKVDIPSVFDFSPDFDKFYYAPRSLSDSDSLMACMAMFDELGFTSRYRIRKDTLTRFCLMVKKGYRNPPYHNWMHAYAVTHFCYLLIQNIKLEKYLEPIEMFALFVSCMCHDIDHRGTTNSFQVQSQSVLAALYSSEGSVMERHHFAQSMCIVNTEGCNIFENLSSKDYQSVLDLMRDIILATDLAHHLRILKQLQEMAVNGYDQTKPRNKKFLLCLLMTSCDLSDQTKNWDNTKHIASLVYQEFFSQGDMEKNTGKKPLEMMDREKANIPDLQISFLDGIASPVYKVLGQLFDECQVVYQAVLENRRKWEKIRHILTVRPGSTNKHQLSMEEILKIEDVDNEELTQQQINGR